MRRHIQPAAIAALAIFFTLLSIVGQVVIDNPMSTARDAAVAVALKDGRILAIGGKDAAGNALDTAEYLGAGSALVSKLSSPRTGHIAVTLNDGRVLIAGGRNAQGAIVNTTEIFDPIAESFSLASSSMLEARAGATATLLEDGRVFIAGGEGPSGVLASTEIFDPATGLFSPRAPMSTPRRGHAAAEASEIVLHQDHRVVIAGGNNGSPDSSGDLASIEVYDHATNTMSVFPAAMANARAGLTATPLLRGQILLAGGTVAGAATAATEILDLPAATLAPGPAMSQPRTGHFSVLLPDNNTVLMAGGATASPAAEIFVSWQNQFQPFGALAAARTGIAAAATSANHMGIARIGGGTDAAGVASNASEKAQFATVWTNKQDYQPDDHVLLSGAGFAPGETVHVEIDENPHSHDDVTVDITAGAGGSFTDVDVYAVQLHDVAVRFFLSASGQQSGRTGGTTFTDGNAANGDGTMTVSPIAVAPSSTGNTFTFTFTAPNGKDFNSGSQATILVPNGWTTPTTSNVSVSAGTCSAATRGTITGSGPWTIPINMNCTGGSSFTVTYSSITAPATTGVNMFTTQTKQNGGTLTNIGSSPTVTVAAPPTISKAFSDATITLNGTTTLTFTLSNSNSFALTGVAFTDNFPAGLEVSNPHNKGGTCVGTFNPSPGSTSISLTAGTIPASGNCTLTVDVKGTTTGAKNNTTGAISSTNGGTGTTSNTATLTVNPACTGPTVTLNPSSQTVALGNNASFSATASGTPAPTIQWQVSTGGGPFSNISGATSSPLTFAVAAADNSKQYRAVFTNTCGTVNTAAATLTVTAHITFNSAVDGNPASGRTVTVDGGNQTTSYSTDWVVGSTGHTIDAPDPQSGAAGVQYAWVSWSGTPSNTTKSQTITAPNADTTYTVNFKTQYQITFAQSGIAGDTTATVVTINGTTTKTAAQLSYSAWYDTGSSLAFSFASTVASTTTGKQYVLTNAGSLPTSPITVGAGNANQTITGNYKTQWQLTFTVSGTDGDYTNTIVTVGGSAIPAGSFASNSYTQWVDDNSSAPSVTWNDPLTSSVTGKRYHLTGSTALTSPVTSAQTSTGTYQKQWRLTFTVSGTDSDYTGNVVKVGGVDIAAGSFTADSHVQWVDDASTAPSVVWSDPLNTSVTGKRYHLTGSTALTSPVTSVQTSTGTYQKQYQVTFGQTGIGGDTGTNQVLAVTVNGTATPYDASHLTTPSTWYDAGTALAWTYSSPVASTTAGKQYVLDTAVSPNPNPLGPIASLAAPVSVSATYKTQYQVIFAESGLDADAGTLQVLSLSINGGGPTSYNRTNLPSEWYDAGSNLNYTYSSPITVNAGEQFVLTSPSPNPSPAGPISNLSAATTVTGTYQKQWKLTFTVAGTNGDYTGTVVTVGGTPVLAGSFTSNSYTQWVNHNSPAPSVTWNDPLTSSVTGKRYRLTGSTSLTTPVTAPQTSEGTYQKQWLLTFTVKGTAATDGDYSGTVVTVGGTPIAAGSFTAHSYTQWVDDNTTAPSVTWNDPLTSSVSGKRYVLTGSTALTSPVTSAQASEGTYKTQYQVTFGQTGIGGDTGTNQVLAVTVNGTATPYDASHLTTPSTWYDAGTALAWTYSSPVASSAGKQYVLDPAVSPNPNPLGPIASLAAPVSVSATYKTQYQVTFATSGMNGDTGANIVLTRHANSDADQTFDKASLPSGVWYDDGTVLTYTYSSPVAATTGKQYVLTATAPASPLTVHGTHTITGTYKIQWLVTYQQTGISADADSNTILTLPGPLNKNYANFVAGATQWVDDNTNAGFTWAPTVATNTTGKRYAFVSSTPSSLPNVTAPATVSATYKTQYYLTITTNPGDVPRSTQVTPADGWYDDNGVNISLTAALSYTAGGGTGYTFKNWTGDVPGSPNTSDPLSVPMNQPRTVVANYTTWGLTWGTNTYTAQYSDPMQLQATLTADGSPVSGKVISFSVGTDTGSGTTNASGVAATGNTAVLTQAPGNYTAGASCPVVQCGVLLTITYNPYVITKEDARATYTGSLFVSTASTTSGNFTATLAATIQDITAVTGDPDYDAYGGDIRNAKVTFVNRDTNTNISGCVDLPVGLVSAADTKVGTATCNWSSSISGDSQQFTIGIVVNNYYTRNASGDNTLVTVSKPLATSFITGGGYLLMTSPNSTSSGLAAGAPGTKNNFGFNVKYNKQGTNLQGNINTIVRSTLGPLNGCPAQPGGIYVYQVKGNAMTSLSVTPTTPTTGTAIFNGKANIQDISNPLVSCAVDGNATLQVEMTDSGEPGNADSIGVSVWNKTGGMWFSSNWNGTKTQKQTLGGGNLQVR